MDKKNKEKIVAFEHFVKLCPPPPLNLFCLQQQVPPTSSSMLTATNPRFLCTNNILIQHAGLRASHHPTGHQGSKVQEEKHLCLPVLSIHQKVPTAYFMHVLKS